MILNRLLKPTVLLAMLSCSLQLVSAQNKVITGKITDSKDGSAMSNVSVFPKGMKTGTQTDASGYFSLTLPASLNTIHVSTVGFASQDVNIGGKTNIEVTLVAMYSSMNDVVVLGYGTAKKKDLTGAVTQITAKEFNTGVITNPLQQVQGKVAGLVIVQPGGDPNGDFIVRVRGATSLEGQPPLLVIDGVSIDDFNKSITTLNPADIESFNILKDASAAAIYGARGANGVIIVTTKKAKAGKPQVDYTGFVGAEKISNEIEVLNADQYRKVTGDSSGFDQGANTDWQKAISQTGISQSHTIGISGGNNEINFRGSVGYTRREGVVINSGNEVVTARINANQKSLNDKLEINYGLNVSVINRRFLPDQNSTSQVRQFGSGVFYAALVGLPVVKTYNQSGTGYQGPSYYLNNIFSKNRENFLQATVKADYELLKGFKVGILGTLSRSNNVYDYFAPTPPNSDILSAATKTNDNGQFFSHDIHGNYQKKFGKHSIDITGVYECNEFTNDGFGVIASGFLIPELLNNNLGAATQVLTSGINSYKNEVMLISFLGRVVYNYDDRYMLTANFRRDGSSKFGPNHRWGEFPSVSVAWRASNETFFKDIKWLDNLKFRVSYGLTGNQENLEPYPYQLVYGPTGPYLYNGQFLQGYGITQQDNPDLKWEVRQSFNWGLDFSIFNRLNGTIDVFNDKTRDMLFTYPLSQPPFLFNSVTANAANAENRGVEITVSGKVIRDNKFHWDATINLATLKSRITNLSGKFQGADLLLTSEEQHYGYAQGGGLSGAYISQLKVGYPAGVFWIPQHAGLDANGHELYKNYDAAGKFIGTSDHYTDQDRVFIDPTPHYTWGITNTFTLDNFDLSIFFRGVQGQKIFANSLMVLGTTVNLPYSNVSVKALTNGFKVQPQPSNYWLQNGSYTRLENLTLGYNFKKIKGISKLRIYLSASNLFVITGYEGIDPEINTDGSQRYIDNNYYPKTRGITFGTNVVF